MSAFTANVRTIDSAPRRIELLGDKTRRPEPAQHVIEFPGGAVEVSRTTDGRYWAHINIHRESPIDDTEGRVSATGKVCDARLYIDGEGFRALGDMSHASQIAVLIGCEVKA